jgi:hypothetical protein
MPFDRPPPPLDYAGPRREAGFEVRPATAGERVLGCLAWAIFLGAAAFVVMYVIVIVVAIVDAGA